MKIKNYRVECNYGSKYFNRKIEAIAYFAYCKSRVLACELWQNKVIQSDDVYSHIQILLMEYSPKG